jgi:PAS domain-containing protein
MSKRRAKAAKSTMAWRWFLVTLALSCVTILAVVFSLWELIEHRYFRDPGHNPPLSLHQPRGRLVPACWPVGYLVRPAGAAPARGQLERSYEHYRALLNNMPEAVVLIDESFRVLEWNQAARSCLV